MLPGEGPPPPLPHRTPVLEARFHWRVWLSAGAATAQTVGQLRAKKGKTIREGKKQRDKTHPKMVQKKATMASVEIKHNKPRH